MTTPKTKKHKEEDIRKFLKKKGIPSLARALTKVMPKKHMTIKELIKKLQKFPLNYPVMFENNEMLEDVEIVEAAKKVGSGERLVYIGNYHR